MRILLVLMAIMGLSHQALAQNPGNANIEAGKAIFSEMERRVIREVMGRVGLPADTSTAKTEEQDDDDGERKGYKSKGKNKGKGKGKGKGKNKGMPPGLAKKDTLPPGLAKRDTLPPGLAKRDLPSEVTRELPPPPAGTERVIVDNDVVLVEKGTQMVLDIIKDVIISK